MSIPNRRRVEVQSLPQLKHGWTFLYAEQVKVERKDHGVALQDKTGTVHVPAAMITCLMLGPGSTLTHAAATVLADCGCSINWVGEGGVRFYAAGVGGTNRSANLLHQAAVWAAPDRHAEVVFRMYRMRFASALDPALSLAQVRGKEGVRVRDAYARAAAQYGIDWKGRRYKRVEWGDADDANRALSTANACLHGLCHGAIVSTGFSPGLGFIHTGKLLSFVYDIADLYKVDFTVPLAFTEAAQGPERLESRVRRACRDAFVRMGFLGRIVPDIQTALGLRPEVTRVLVHDVDEDTGVSGIWDPSGALPGGRNYGEDLVE